MNFLEDNNEKWNLMRNDGKNDTANEATWAD